MNSSLLMTISWRNTTLVLILYLFVCVFGRNPEALQYHMTGITLSTVLTLLKELSVSSNYSSSTVAQMGSTGS